MSGAWVALATTGVGAAATIIGIVIGGFVGRRSDERKWIRDARTEAYVTFLREYVRLEMELREAYSVSRADAANWDAYNTALVALSLVASRDVGAAIEPMHAPIREMLLLRKAGSSDHATYQRVHASMSRAYLAFVNAARRSVDLRSEPLDSVVGGPPPWHMIEQWLPRPTSEGATGSDTA
jgi:hypothetical protein